ncbi:MAG: sigma-70 family RNA polymerase sigma factor [Planctomycetota bacterium]|jgi:RNA polymerase sigma-70 factor (ECF subfamily)
MEKTDFELAAEHVRSGGSGPFQALVDRHSRLVYHVAFRITGDHHEAEDVTQDVFLVLLRTMHKFEEGKSFRAWAAGITFHTAMKAVRSRTRRAERERSVMAASGNGGIEGREPASEAERRELAGHVEELLGALPPENRVPLVLHHLEGFTYAEVGEALGVPEGTVKSRVSRGLEQVRTGVSGRGREITLAALVPLFGEIPSPALPPGLVASLKALPLQAAATATAAAKTTTLATGGIFAKIAAAAAVVCLAAVGGVFLFHKAGTEFFDPSADVVETPPEEAWVPEELPPLEPLPEVGGIDVPPPPADASVAESGEGKEPEAQEPAGNEAGEAPRRVRIGDLEGVVVRSKGEVKPSIRRLSAGEGLEKLGNIRIGGGPGGRGRFAPAGWSKWARRPPKKGNCTVTGWVLDADRKPVAGADVYRMKPDTDRGPELKVSFGDLVKVTKTDAAGAFAAKYLPAGEYYMAGNYRNVLNTDRGLYTEGAVKVSLPPRGKKDGAFSIPALRAGVHTVIAQRTGYRPVEESVEVVGGRDTSVSLVLPLREKGSFGVSGTVTDHEGRPVSGAAVYLMGNRRTLRSGKTDGTGGFRFDGVAPKEVRFQVSKQGYRTHVATLALPSWGMAVLLEKTAVVTGTVKSSGTGALLDLFNIKLYVLDDEGNWRISRTQSRYSEDGSFRVEGRCGKWLLEVEAPDHEKGYFEIEMPVEGDEIKSVDLLLEPTPK